MTDCHPENALRISSGGPLLPAHAVRASDAPVMPIWPQKTLAGFVCELIHYKTEIAAKTPSIHAAQGGVNEHIDRKAPVYPADIYGSPPNRSRARWLRVYRFALMHKASMQTLMRQALAQIGNAALMTPGRYISQRVRHTLR